MAPCCPRATKFPEMCDMHLLRRRLLPDTQDPVRSPTTCGCFWCKFGVRDRTGSLCLGRLDGVRNGWNSCPTPAFEAPESLLQCGHFSGKRKHRLFSHNQEPLACLQSAITQEPIAHKRPV